MSTRRLTQGRHGRSPRHPDRPAVRRPATTRVPRPRACRRPGALPARRARHRHRRNDAGRPDGHPRGAGSGAAARLSSTTHDLPLAGRALPVAWRRSTAGSSPHGPGLAHPRSGPARPNLRRPPAGARRPDASCSTTPTTTISRPARARLTTTKKRSAADGRALRAASVRLLPASAASRRPAGRRRVRGRRQLRRARRASPSSATPSPTLPFRALSSPISSAAPYVIGGGIAAFLTAIGIGWVTRRSRLRVDTAIGVVFAGTFALGIFLYSTINGYVGDLFGFLVGNVLAISTAELISLLVLGAVRPGLVSACFWKELLYSTFDPLGAAASGLPVAALDYLFLGLDRGHHRGQPAGRRHRPGGGDAGHAAGDGAAADCSLLAADPGRVAHRRRDGRRRAVPRRIGSTSPAARRSCSCRAGCSSPSCCSTGAPGCSRAGGAQVAEQSPS